MTEGLRIGSTVTIHSRSADGSAGEVVGNGQIIHPQLVQVLPPLDDELAAVPHRREDFVLVTDSGQHEVLRIRPGLVDFTEASEILAREIPQVRLADTQGGFVAFETAEWLAEDLDRICDNPWWCRVVCLSSCTAC